MNTLLTIGGLILALFGVVWLAVRQGRAAGFSQGKQEAEKAADEKLDQVQNEHNAEVIAQHEKAVEDVQDVKEIHDRLEHDDAYADSVRDRFTRD